MTQFSESAAAAKKRKNLSIVRVVSIHLNSNSWNLHPNFAAIQTFIHCSNIPNNYELCEQWTVNSLITKIGQNTAEQCCGRSVFRALVRCCFCMHWKWNNQKLGQQFDKLFQFHSEHKMRTFQFSMVVRAAHTHMGIFHQQQWLMKGSEFQIPNRN